MDNKPKVICEIPAGSKITTFDGRLVVAEPNTPPYFLEVDAFTMQATKVPVDLDKRLPPPMHQFMRF